MNSLKRSSLHNITEFLDFTTIYHLLFLNHTIKVFLKQNTEQFKKISAFIYLRRLFYKEIDINQIMKQIAKYHEIELLLRLIPIICHLFRNKIYQYSGYSRLSRTFQGITFPKIHRMNLTQSSLRDLSLFHSIQILKIETFPTNFKEFFPKKPIQVDTLICLLEKSMSTYDNIEFNNAVYFISQNVINVKSLYCGLSLCKVIIGSDFEINNSEIKTFENLEHFSSKRIKIKSNEDFNFFEMFCKKFTKLKTIPTIELQSNNFYSFIMESLSNLENLELFKIITHFDLNEIDNENDCDHLDFLHDKRFSKVSINFINKNIFQENSLKKFISIIFKKFSVNAVCVRSFHNTSVILQMKNKRIKYEFQIPNKEIINLVDYLNLGKIEFSMKSLVLDEKDINFFEILKKAEKAKKFSLIPFAFYQQLNEFKNESNSEKIIKQLKKMKNFNKIIFEKDFKISDVQFLLETFPNVEEIEISIYSEKKKEIKEDDGHDILQYCREKLFNEIINIGEKLERNLKVYFSVKIR